jgi:DNA-directed RNA polymerase subunit F
MEGLARFGDKEIIGEIISMLKNKNPGVRARAFRIIGSSKMKLFIRHIVPLLDDKERSGEMLAILAHRTYRYFFIVRDYVMEALEKITGIEFGYSEFASESKKEEIVEEIKKIVSYIENRVKLDRDEIQMLLNQLGHEDFKTREKAHERLVRAGGDAPRELRGALKKAKDAEVVWRIKEIITKIEKVERYKGAFGME